MESKRIDPFGETKYPCLLQYKDDYVILATSEEQNTTTGGIKVTGIVVYASALASLELGYYSKGWDKECFIPYRGKIELSNDE